MDSIHTSILAVVQGITELLPISSTGHILLFSKILFKQDPSVLLLTLLQFGTTISILFAFKDYLFKDMFKKEKLILYMKVIVASIPAVLVALLFEKSIESTLYNNEIIAISLFVWGIAMICVENKKINKKEVSELEKVTLFQAIGVGVAQALAIIPGTSRSGVTIVAGVVLGIEKYNAIKFSFLLGLPLLLGSFLYEMYKFRNSMDLIFTQTNILGIVISCVVGFIAISVLKKYSTSKFLTFFGIYRIILAILLFLLVIKL